MQSRPGPKPYPVRIRGVDYPSPAAAAAHFSLSVGVGTVAQSDHPGPRRQCRPRPGQAPRQQEGWPATQAGDLRRAKFASCSQFQREVIGYKSHRRMQRVLTAGADERIIGRLMRRAITAEQQVVAKRPCRKRLEKPEDYGWTRSTPEDDMAPRVGKAHIRSSIEAVQACDLPIVSVTVLRDGSVLIRDG